MQNRKVLTCGLALGLTALAVTCLAKNEKTEEKKSNEPAVNSQVETSVTTNGTMVTERRRETRTVKDKDGNVVETSTREYLQSYPVGDTATAGVVAAPDAKAEPVETKSFLGLEFGSVYKVDEKDTEREDGEPSLLRAKFKPAKPLAGFDDYYVYVTPKTHKVAQVCACAKKAIDAGRGGRRHYLVEALQKRYRTWARPVGYWGMPCYKLDVAPGRHVTICLAGASDDYETVLSAWDEEATALADEEQRAVAEEQRKKAEKERDQKVLDATNAF